MNPLDSKPLGKAIKSKPLSVSQCKQTSKNNRDSKAVSGR